MATTSKTQVFVWQGVDKQGRKTRGELSAGSSALVNLQVRAHRSPGALAHKAAALTPLVFFLENSGVS